MEHLKTTLFDFPPASAATRRRAGYPLTLQKPHGVRRLGHLSDFHFGKRPADEGPSEEAVQRWLAAFAEADIDVLLVTGDLVEVPGDRTKLLRAKQMLDQAPFAYQVIPGNHDIAEPGVPGRFEEMFGHYPRVEHHHDVEFVLFDSMMGLPASQRGLFERMQGQTGAAYSRGAVGDAQMSEVEHELHPAPKFGRVMLVHHHLRTNAPTQQGHEHHPTQPHGLMGPLNDAHQLVEWAAEHHFRLVVHGHKHSFWDPYEPAPGVIVLNSGSSTLGKPGRPRRGRIVDVWPGVESIAVHDLELPIEEPA